MWRGAELSVTNAAAAASLCTVHFYFVGFACSREACASHLSSATSAVHVDCSTIRSFPSPDTIHRATLSPRRLRPPSRPEVVYRSRIVAHDSSSSFVCPPTPAHCLSIVKWPWTGDHRSTLYSRLATVARACVNTSQPVHIRTWSASMVTPAVSGEQSTRRAVQV